MLLYNFPHLSHVFKAAFGQAARMGFTARTSTAGMSSSAATRAVVFDVQYPANYAGPLKKVYASNNIFCACF